jgi:phosphoribosylaminoimidazolecarboxamide formyltransferase/IMP cyclohydrolase
MLNKVSNIDDYIPVRHALISVSDKKELRPFIQGLVRVNPDIRIFSTGDTYKKIAEILGEKKDSILRQVSDYTGQPEMQGGLVKTLDFKIYLGLLSETYNPHHREDLNRTDAVPIDLVVVNLYPFRETIAAFGVTPEDARANIDIGGPSMLRASAKNYLRVLSICDPDDYPLVVEEMELNQGKVSFETRFKCAKKVFKHTAEYDNAISGYLNQLSPGDVKKLYTYGE